MTLISQRTDGALFELTISFVGQVGPTDLAYLQFFNIIMRKCLQLLRFTQIGRHYFDTEAVIDKTEIGYQLIPGFITNIRQYETQLMMSIEITHRVLRSSTCLRIIKEQNYDRSRVADILVGGVIMTRYNNRTYRIDDIDWNQNPKTVFDCKGSKTSLVDYYQQKYQIQITDMRQPLLVSNPRKEDLHRGDNKVILLVPELCFPTGISDQDRKNYHLMTELAKHLQQGPTSRANTTLRFMQRLRASDDVGLNFCCFSPTKLTPTNLIFFHQTRKELGDWGLGFEGMNLVAIEEGRVLPTETLLFKDGSDKLYNVKVHQNADWTGEMKTGIYFKI